VFWYNIVDANKFRHIKEFFVQLFSRGFQIHTPILSLQSFFAFASIITCIIKPKLEKTFTFLTKAELSFNVSRIIVFLNFFVFMLAISFDNKYMGVLPGSSFYDYGSYI